MAISPVTLNSLATQVKALDARITALEEATVKNRLTIRAILTILHPQSDHDAANQKTLEWASKMRHKTHDLLMAQLEEMGGRVEGIE